MLAVVVGALPSGFTKTTIGYLNQAIDVEFLPNGLMLTVSRAGTIMISNPNSVPLGYTTYLDISAYNDYSGEKVCVARRCISLTPTGPHGHCAGPQLCHQRWAQCLCIVLTTGYFYAYYARNGVPGGPAAALTTSRISRFTHVEAGANSYALPSSEVVLW